MPRDAPWEQKYADERGKRLAISSGWKLGKCLGTLGLRRRERMAEGWERRDTLASRFSEAWDEM